MRKSIRSFIQMVSETLTVPEPIYEFGSLQVEGQEGFADLRPLFPGKRYVGCDMREGPGVDLVMDLHDLRLEDGAAGTMLMMDTLEHVEFPREAMAGVHRILREDGLLVMSSVMNFPIHAHPNDYWRFTPEAFRSLMRDFPVAHADFAGDEEFPHTVVGVARKGTQPLPPEFFDALDRWKKRWYFLEGNSWRNRKKMLLPPILHGHFLRKLAATLRR